LLWGLLPLKVWVDTALVKQALPAAEESAPAVDDAEELAESGLYDDTNGDGSSEALPHAQRLRTSAAIGQYVGTRLSSYPAQCCTGRDMCVRLCRWLL
jgi:hypothetical protein